MLENFLIIFTKRLCEIEPDNVEFWVDLEYFPKR